MLLDKSPLFFYFENLIKVIGLSISVIDHILTEQPIEYFRRVGKVLQ